MYQMNMHEAIDHDRRRFFGAAALTFTAAELGVIGAAHAETQPAPLPAIKPGANTSFVPLKQVDAGVLNVGYAEVGRALGELLVGQTVRVLLRLVGEEGLVVLEHMIGIVDTDAPGLAWEKLSARLGELLDDPQSEGGRSAASKTAVIGRLLGIDGPGDAALWEQSDAQRAREIFFAAVRSCVEGLARERPLVLVWEDIQKVMRVLGLPIAGG